MKKLFLLAFLLFGFLSAPSFTFVQAEVTGGDGVTPYCDYQCSGAGCNPCTKGTGYTSDNKTGSCSDPRMVVCKPPTKGTTNVTPTPTTATESVLESDDYSGLIPCGRSGNGGASEPCTACHAVVGVKRLMDYLTSIMVVVAITVIVAMGVLYILSGVNADLKKRAKTGLQAVVFGLVFMLSAWLIVSTILRFMANEQFVNGGGGFIGLAPGEGVYGLQCSTYSDAGRAVMQDGVIVDTRSKDYKGTYGGTGTCQAPSAGPCSPQSLQGTCFGGAHVNTWSAICQAESGGSASVPSGTDKCTGDGSVVSFGLFQINISANKIGGLNCPAAFSSVFSGSNKNCRVINRELYNQCVLAAKDAQKNIQTACSLASPNSTNTRPWGAARRCNIPPRL